MAIRVLIPHHEMNEAMLELTMELTGQTEEEIFMGYAHDIRDGLVNQFEEMGHIGRNSDGWSRHMVEGRHEVDIFIGLENSDGSLEIMGAYRLGIGERGYGQYEGTAREWIEGVSLEY